MDRGDKEVKRRSTCGLASGEVGGSVMDDEMVAEGNGSSGVMRGVTAVTSQAALMVNNLGSYAAATKRKFPFLVVDFWSDESGGSAGQRRIPLPVLVEFLEGDLGLRGGELLELRHTGGRQLDTWRIRTKGEIIVKERFESATEFTRKSGGVMWMCSIRGGRSKNEQMEEKNPLPVPRPTEQRFPTLKLLNPPEECEDEEIKEAIKPFAIVKSEIRSSAFRESDHPFLAGVLDGNKVVRYAPRPGVEIPKRVLVRGQRVRILILDGQKRCFRCGKPDHLAAGCVEGEDEDEEEVFEECGGRGTGGEESEVEGTDGRAWDRGTENQGERKTRSGRNFASGGK